MNTQPKERPLIMRPSVRSLLTATFVAALVAAAATPAAAEVEESSPFDWLSGPTATLVPSPSAPGGYWAAFGGVGVRAVLGAPDLWEPPTIGSSGDLASNVGSTIVPNLAGSGYWVLQEDGTVYEFGGAPEMCARDLTSCGFSGAVVGAAAVPNLGSAGMWIVNDDGRVYGTPGVTTYGDWTDGGHVPVAIVSTPTGKGYYILEKDGGIASKGDAVFHGAGRNADEHTWTGMALSLDDSGAVNGYWTMTTDGTLYPYGDAQRYGFTGPDSLIHLSHAQVAGFAPVPGGQGFAILQGDGQVTVFPNSGGSPSTTSQTNQVTTETGDTGTTYTFALTVKNESSRDVTFVPHTSTTTGLPRGTGFTSNATDSYAALPTGQSIQVGAGDQSATWPVTMDVLVPGRDAPDAQSDAAVQLQFDITPDSDLSDRQRVSLTQDRQAIMREPVPTDAPPNTPWQMSYQLLRGPQLAAVGSGSLEFRVEEAWTAGVADGWTVVISDPAEATYSAPPTPAITQLSAPYDANADSGNWAYLENPVYRIDVPAVTQTWTGEVPGRLEVEPATVYSASLSGTTAVGTLIPTSAPVFDEVAGTVTFGPASFYYQQAGRDETGLEISGGWVTSSSASPVQVSYSSDAAPPIAPADTILSGLALQATTQDTPAVPDNGLGSQHVQLTLQNNSIPITQNDPLAWLYDLIFFVDGEGKIVTGLGPVSGDDGFSSITPIEAGQVVSTELEPAVSLTADDSSADLWLASSIDPTANLQIGPVLSVQIANQSGGGSTVNNFSATSPMAYATFDPVGDQLSGDLTDGVTMSCVVPTGVEPCIPTAPTTVADTTTLPLYRDGAGALRTLTQYLALQSPQDATPPDNATLGMFQGEVVVNPESGEATLSNPPASSQLPKPNPLFSISLVSAAGQMVMGDISLIDSSATDPDEPPAFTADAPPADAVVGALYSYSFAADGATGYGVGGGTLPPGLGIDPATGLVSGIPTEPGRYEFRIVASNAAGDTLGASHTVTVTAAAAVNPPAGDDPAAGAGDGTRPVTALGATGGEPPFGLLTAAVLAVVLGAGLAWATARRRRQASAAAASDLEREVTQ